MIPRVSATLATVWPAFFPYPAIHLWHASLAELRRHPGWISACLTVAERERAARMKAEAHNFAAGRAFVKTVLGLYTSCAPRDIAFSYGPFGKPYWQDRTFSIARTAQDVFCVVTTLPTIGVDCEEPATSLLTSDWATLSPFLHQKEQEAFAHAEHSRADLLCLWVRKEAIVKACGASMLNLARHLAVSPDPSESTGFAYTATGSLLSRWHCPILVWGPVLLACAVPETGQGVPIACVQYTLLTALSVA